MQPVTAGAGGQSADSPSRTSDWFCRFTHPYPNFPILPLWGPPKSPQCFANGQRMIGLPAPRRHHGGRRSAAGPSRFSGKREKDQVSIGSDWWQWTQQAPARIPSTVRSYFPMLNLEPWIGPAQVTSYPSHASPTRTAFRSRVRRTGAAFARGAGVPLVRSRAGYDGGARLTRLLAGRERRCPASP